MICISSKQAYQWEISFNQDISKLGQEFNFSKKTTIQWQPVLTFGNSPMMKTSHNEDLGLILNEKLTIKERLKENIKSP